MADESSSRMIQSPNFDPVLSKVESKFALITVINKRAKQLTNGSRPLVDSRKVKAVSIALEEIAADKIKYHKTPDRDEERIARLTNYQ